MSVLFTKIIFLFPNMVSTLLCILFTAFAILQLNLFIVLNIVLIFVNLFFQLIFFFVIYCPEILFVLNIISFWNYSPTLSLVANYYPILFFLIKIVITFVELFFHLILVVKYCVILSSLF